MIRGTALACALLAAGCATTPEDELLGSAAIVRSLEVERDDVVEVARFSGRRAGPLPADWRPWLVPAKPRTAYRLVESEGGMVLQADAARAASGKVKHIRIDPRRHPIVEWRWRVPSLIAGADPRHASSEDSPVRILVSFHGDEKKLDTEDRTKMRFARALTGQALPYATLMYVWANDLPAGSVVENPHTGRVRMLVVESGPAATGRWRNMRRNVLEDYRRAFGEEPWDIVAVGVMTDSDNTGTHTRAYYGDIRFRRE